MADARPAPRVSICIPAYNAEAYIASAIESVRRQTYPGWELVVVDDCSIDGTRTVLQALLERAADPRITLHANTRVLGMAGNWNRAVELASAEFVKLLCDDDLVEPDCIEMQVAAMDRHPGVSLVTCSRKILSATGKVLFIRRSFRRDGVYPGRAVIARCIRGGTNLIGEPSAVLLRRATLERAGRFRESVVYYTDLDLWLRVLMHGDLYFIAAPKASFRIHVQSATRGAEGKMLADYFRVADAICGATQTELTCLQRFWLSWKVRSLNAARRAIYNRLAQR